MRWNHIICLLSMANFVNELSIWNQSKNKNKKSAEKKIKKTITRFEIYIMINRLSFTNQKWGKLSDSEASYCNDLAIQARGIMLGTPQMKALDVLKK